MQQHPHHYKQLNEFRLRSKISNYLMDYATPLLTHSLLLSGWYVARIPKLHRVGMQISYVHALVHLIAIWLPEPMIDACQCYTKKFISIRLRTTPLTMFFSSFFSHKFRWTTPLHQLGHDLTLAPSTCTHHMPPQHDHYQPPTLSTAPLPPPSSAHNIAPYTWTILHST